MEYRVEVKEHAIKELAKLPGIMLVGVNVWAENY